MLDLGPHAARYSTPVPLGGNSPVLYRATDVELGRPVLIKAVPRLSAGASTQAALFLRGARAAARLDSPHIVRVYDLFSAPSADVLVQEDVDGPTLDELLREHPDRRLPVERAFAIAAELADALAVAHRYGLVHRNLGPGSVVLTRAGAVKLGGFEAAVVPAAAGATADPWSGDAQLGNPLYTAPEQMRGEPVDARADIFSLGVLLYQMLTGRPPFTGSNAMAVAYHKQNTDPPAPSKARKDLPAATDRLMRRLLGKRPSDRPRDVTEVGTELRAIAAPAPAPDRDRRDDVVLHYPTPIAKAYARVWREWDWGVRLDGMFELVETVLKYCAVGSVLAACDARGEAAPPHLAQLARPSFGKWLEYLRAAVESQPGASPFVDRMRAALFPRSGPRPAEVIEKVIRARNDQYHGRARRPAADDEGPFRELQPDVHDLLAALRWLTEFPLVQAVGLNWLQGDSHPHVVRYRLCAGVATTAGAEHTVQLANGVAKNDLGILDPATRTFLDLAPFVRYSRCPVCDEEDVFVYHGMPAARRVLLMSCHGPHELPDETPHDPFEKRGLVWSD